MQGAAVESKWRHCGHTWRRELPIQHGTCRLLTERPWLSWWCKLEMTTWSAIQPCNSTWWLAGPLLHYTSPNRLNAIVSRWPTNEVSGHPCEVVDSYTSFSYATLINKRQSYCKDSRHNNKPDDLDLCRVYCRWRAWENSQKRKARTIPLKCLLVLLMSRLNKSSYCLHQLSLQATFLRACCSRWAVVLCSFNYIEFVFQALTY